LVCGEKELGQIAAELLVVFWFVLVELHPMDEVDQPETKVVRVDVGVVAKGFAQLQQRFLLLEVVYLTCERAFLSAICAKGRLTVCLHTYVDAAPVA